MQACLIIGIMSESQILSMPSGDQFVDELWGSLKNPSQESPVAKKGSLWWSLPVQVRVDSQLSGLHVASPKKSNSGLNLIDSLTCKGMSIFRAWRIGIQRPEVWFVLEKFGIFVLKLISGSLRTTYLKCSSNRARVPCVEPANCRIITTMDCVVLFVQTMLFRFIRSLVFSD